MAINPGSTARGLPSTTRNKAAAPEMRNDYVPRVEQVVERKHGIQRPTALLDTYTINGFMSAIMQRGIIIAVIPRCVKSIDHTLIMGPYPRATSLRAESLLAVNELCTHPRQTARRTKL